MNPLYPDAPKPAKPSKEERALTHDDLLRNAAAARRKASEAANEDARKEYLEIAEMWGAMADLRPKTP